MPSRAGHPIVLTFDAVTVGFGRRTVLDGLALEIRRGEILGLVGPNGGGKTTILRTLVGIVRPRTGRVVRHEPGLTTGYVPQRETLDPIWPLTALEVVVMARYPRIGLFRRAGAADRAHARAALDYVGLADLADRSYRDLSGGQMQRVLLARALATDPDVLVLDEPTYGMDLPASTALLALVRRLNRERGLTIVMASHLLDDVANLADRVGLVRAGTVLLGEAGALLTSETLTRLYGIPVSVQSVNGRRAIQALPSGD